VRELPADRVNVRSVHSRGPLLQFSLQLINIGHMPASWGSAHTLTGVELYILRTRMRIGAVGGASPRRRPRGVPPIRVRAGVGSPSLLHPRLLTITPSA